MNRKKYQYHFNKAWFVLIFSIWVFLRGIRILINLSNPFMDNLFLGIITMIIFIGIGILLSISLLSGIINGIINIVFPYRKGQYLTIKGRCENVNKCFFPEGNNDSFEIGGVPFDISLFDGMPGNSFPAAYGGINMTEGDIIKIEYVPYKEKNFIMSMILLQKEDEGKIR